MSATFSRPRLCLKLSFNRFPQHAIPVSVTPHHPLIRSMATASASNAKSPTTLSRPPPKATWDSHMHIVLPDQFPVQANAQYKPHAHTLAQASDFYDQLGIDGNMVIVQPSIYGNDNTCTLHALKQIQEQGRGLGRGVVQFDPNTITSRELDAMHEVGVRGVRLNLVSVGREMIKLDLRKEVQRYAKVIRGREWVLNLFVPMRYLKWIEDDVKVLGVKVVVDHMGHPSLPAYDEGKERSVYEMEGFESLVRMCQGRGKVWVKMSAPYRITKDVEGGMRDIDPMGRELMKECADRVVWASDWPHTRFDDKIGVKECVEWVERVRGWAGGTEGEEKVFRKNAEELWDVR